MHPPRLISLAALVPMGLALLEEKFVSFESDETSMPLHDATLVYSSEDPVGVRIACESLANDFNQITGRNLPIVVANSSMPSSVEGNVILAATVDSTLINGLVDNEHIDVSQIQGKWETFQTTVIEDPFPNVPQALVITGSDKRGVMFGVFTLAEQSGQSPFHWWADVPAAQHQEIYALDKTTVHGEPTVKYRGLFINDEAPALTGWWSDKHGVDHYPLDTEFYQHVFDLLLRLRANFMWPAMWKSFVPRPGNIFFTDDPENIQLADDYGIVISTSHHEPMQRASNEWNSTEDGPWDWVENNEKVQEFMREGVRRAARNESYFTLGMRGEGDGPIEGDDPVAILQDAFEAQREMLGDYYGNASAVNQAWTIYKEVYTYYAAGLTPPDDVTLVFTDDNWGNIQRLPLANETARSGGIGMYYHLEYVGVPKSYKWQNSNNLPKIYKELSQAHARGVDRLWVVNVADIKPVELPYSMTMEMAWDMARFPGFDAVPSYLAAFARREFGLSQSSGDGDAAAEEAAAIMLEHSRLLGRRRYESIQPTTYAARAYDESARVLAEWARLEDRVLALSSSISGGGYESAFFHHVQWPVLSGRAYHEVVLGQGLNLYAAAERRNSANALARSVLEDWFLGRDWDLQEQYEALEGGKWAGMLAQPKYDDNGDEEWREPTRDLLMGLAYVQTRQNATYAFGNLGIYAQGSEGSHLQGRSLPSADESAPTVNEFAPRLPVMDRYYNYDAGGEGEGGSWYVEVFHRGDERVAIQWEVETVPYEWITVAPRNGAVSAETPDQRIEVTVDWDAVPDDFVPSNETEREVQVRIDFDTKPWFDYIRLPINNYRVSDGFSGFPETGGVISIEGPHHQRSSSAEQANEGEVGFARIPYLGTRSNSGCLALRPYVDARSAPEAARASWVEYDVYLPSASDGNVTATVYINAALDTDPTLLMEVSLTMDGAVESWTRVLGDPEEPGDTPPEWDDGVQDSVWTLEMNLGEAAEGGHTLRWQANSPEIYLEKLVLDTRGQVKESYLGPPETTRLT